MANIIGIETATEICSVSLNLNNQFVDTIEEKEPNAHSKNLTVLIQQLLKRNNFTFDSLDAVVVSKGPGSYTGLRIGVSTAKGICFAKDIPLIAVNTLESMAHGFINNYSEKIDDNDLICPLIDARRMEVYYTLLNNKMDVIEKTGALTINSDSFKQHVITRKVHFFGNGSEKCLVFFKHDNFKHHNILPSAKYLTEIAQNKFINKDFCDLAYFEPFYLKDFIAIPAKNKVI